MPRREWGATISQSVAGLTCQWLRHQRLLWCKADFLEPKILISLVRVSSLSQFWISSWEKTLSGVTWIESSAHRTPLRLRGHRLEVKNKSPLRSWWARLAGALSYVACSSGWHHAWWLSVGGGLFFSSGSYNLKVIVLPSNHYGWLS